MSIKLQFRIWHTNWSTIKPAIEVLTEPSSTLRVSLMIEEPPLKNPPKSWKSWFTMIVQWINEAWKPRKIKQRQNFRFNRDKETRDQADFTHSNKSSFQSVQVELKFSKVAKLTFRSATIGLFFKNLARFL